MAEPMSFTTASGNLHEQFQLSLYNVDRTSYETLNLIDSVKPHWILSHVVSGCVETTTENETFVATSGDVMIHPPRLPFSEVAKVRGIHEWIQFEATGFPNLDIFSTYPISMVVQLQSPGIFTKSFRKLRETWENSQLPFRNLALSASMFQLLCLVLESWRSSGCTPRSSDLSTTQDRFNTLIDFMNEHMEEKITRDQLASILHLHPVYLDRVFCKIYGMTPMQMLKELRLRKVKQYLENTEDSLASIAFACGLGDAAYLSRLFQRSFSQTPGAYRKMVKKAKENIYDNTN